jgi:hypothetical protein
MNTKVLLTLLTTSLLGLTACDKGGSTFSISSDSSQFQQSVTFTPRKLDVLFVVDNSGSMSSSQTSLAQNFPSFINYFKDKGYDFKIAVTTTDSYYGEQFLTDGCSLCNLAQTQFRASADPTTGQVIRVVDNTTADLEAVFSRNVKVGITGSGDERALSSFKATLDSSLNLGFHRQDAYLAVIIVSDEEDFSHDDININESYAQPTLHTVASYKTFLESFTSGQASTDFSVSTISVLDNACKTALGAGRKIGTRYMELADLTGGTKNSLCGAFDSVLNNISSSIASNTQAQFKLNRKPVIDSIRVIVDGIVVPQSLTDGWNYNATTMIITINGSYAPIAGASIVINFDPESIN